MMTKKGEKGLAIVMSLLHGHYLLFIKSRIMKAALDDPNHLLKSLIEEKEHELVLKELIRIEIIATAIHYAEVFAASLIAMRRYKRFHKFLLDYEIPEIIDFYKNITGRRLTYILNLLQYPKLNLIQDKKLRSEVIASAHDVKSELKR